MKNYQIYSDQFKKAALKKLLSPDSQGLNATAKKIGIPKSTLFSWRQKHGITVSMKTNNNLSPEKKLQIIAETLNLSENELGEYLRKNGLHSSDLEEWKKEFYNSHKSVGRPKKDPEIFKLKEEKKKLEKDLKRKNKALAEMSARIVLLKKSHLIFGVKEEEE